MMIAQVNIHRSTASAVLARMFMKQHLGLALVQEPWYNQGIKGLYVKNAKVIWEQRASSPRACILACRSINYYILTEFLKRDCGRRCGSRQEDCDGIGILCR